MEDVGGGLHTSPDNQGSTRARKNRRPGKTGPVLVYTNASVFAFVQRSAHSNASSDPCNTVNRPFQAATSTRKDPSASKDGIPK